MRAIDRCRSLHPMHADRRLAVTFQKDIQIRGCAVPPRHHVKWATLVTDYGHSFVVVGKKYLEPLGSGVTGENRRHLWHEGEALFEIGNLLDCSCVAELNTFSE